MRVTPKTEEEVANVLTAAIYPFEVLAAEDKLSKAGNEMIQLKLDFGQGHIVFDYLLESLAYKVRHAAHALDLHNEYEAGNLNASDFVGKSGYAKLGVQTDDYGTKNVVKDYVVKTDNIPDESIPF